MGSWGMRVQSGQSAGCLEPFTRRDAMAGVLALGGAVVLGGVFKASAAQAAAAGEDPEAEAVRRLLIMATDDAIDTLTKTEGFWNSSVARIALPELYKSGTGGVQLTEEQKSKLMYEQNRLAEDAIRDVAPMTRAPIEKMEVQDPGEILRGPRTAATSYLRAYIGPRLVKAMDPIILKVLERHRDSYTVSVVKSLPGVELADAARALALEADNAIWYEVGVKEADIRSDPEASGDPVVIAALKKG